MGFEFLASKKFVSVICLGGLSFLAAGRPASAQNTNQQTDSAAAATTMFSEAVGVIPLEERSRRKWDNPVVADFDRDGKPDLLLTEHSRSARLFWNNGGTFSDPYDVIGGDTHGVAVGDYDQDGRVDLIISQGGGGGDNPRNPVAFQINRDRSIEGGEEFSDFERTRGRAAKLVDSNNDGALDLVLSAFPLKSQTKGANHILENTGQGQFDFVAKLPRAAWMGFRTLVTDFNNDGVFDLIFYGGKNMVASRGDAGLAYSDVSADVLGATANTSFVSSISEIDYDNDGDFDLFLTRADHPFERQTFFDEENSRFAFFARNEKFQFDDLTIKGDFELVNLQMAYPHFDVFVGLDKRKLEFKVDQHGHKDFVLKPDQAEGWPTSLAEKGLYIGHLGNGVWRIAGDTKSPTAGVVLNVTSKPQITTPMELPALLLENREGKFVDVTKRLGISLPEQTTSAVAGDFDNNGWSDLFVVRYGNPAMQNKQILYLNQDGKWFEQTDHHGVVSRELGATGGGAEAFDYDNDGDLDLIYSNERGRWHLFTNNGLTADKNNFVTVRVGSSPTKKATAQGATLTIKAGGSTYRRVVGASSAAFSHSADNHLHVGLGNRETVDQAMVQWTNGETETVRINAVNQTIVAGQIE